LRPELIDKLARQVTLAGRVRTNRWPSGCHSAETYSGAIPAGRECDVELAVAPSPRPLNPHGAARSFAARGQISCVFHDLLLKRQSGVLDLNPVRNWQGSPPCHLEEILDTAVVSRFYARRAAAAYCGRTAGMALCRS